MYLVQAHKSLWHKYKDCDTKIYRKNNANVFPGLERSCVCVLGLISGFLFMIIAVIAFIWIHNNEWAMSDTAALDCPQFWLKAIAKLAELFGHTLSHTTTGRLTPM